MESKVIHYNIEFGMEPNIDEFPEGVRNDITGRKMVGDGEYYHLDDESFISLFQRLIDLVKKYKGTGSIGYSILYGDVVEYTFDNGEVVEVKSTHG